MTLSVLVLSDSSSLRTLPRSYCKKTCPRRESPLGRYTRLQALDHVQAAQNEGLRFPVYQKRLVESPRLYRRRYVCISAFPENACRMNFEK
jgi:hypothetical protein